MLRRRVERAIKEYDPTQPRVPAGQPEAGRWTTDWQGKMASFPITAGVQNAVDRMAAAGHKVYVVGGAVRDFLAVKTPHDIDLATDARPEQTKSVFAGKVKFDAGGEAHGMVRVASKGEILEITTLRHDVETDGKHAKVTFTTSIIDDLQRRDLTVNALAFDPTTGKLYGPGPNGDPTQALADLKHKIIRFVGDGAIRITEDLSRATRFVRFATKLHGTPDPASLRAVQQAIAKGQIPDRERLSNEQVRDDLLKTLAVPHGNLRLWKESGLLFAYIPELAPAEHQSQNRHHGDVKVLEHIFRATETVNLPEGDYPAFHDMAEHLDVSPRAAATAMLRLTMLLHDVAKPRTAAEKPDTPGEYSFIGHEHVGAGMAREIGQRLKLPARMVELIEASVDEHMAVPHPGTTDVTIRRWGRRVGERFKALREIGLDPVEWLLAVRQADWGSLGRVGHDEGAADIGADAIRSAMAATPITSKPPVDGGTVMRLTGMKPGPEIGKIVRGVGAFIDANPTATQADIEAEILRLHRG